MISLKQIQYACSLAEHKHFGKAAQHSNVTTAALSTAIAEMEKQLGFVLFERDNKKVLITKLGHQVIEKYHNILLEVKDIYDLKKTLEEPLSGHLSLGIIPTIAPYLLPLILPTIIQQYPDLELEIFEEQSHVLVEKVKKGEIDTAILALPYPLGGLLSLSFLYEKFFLILPKSHLLAKQKTIDSSSIPLDKLLLLKDGHCLKEHALAACHLAENDSINAEATSLATLVQLVDNDMGMTLVPEIAIEQLVRNHPNLAAIPLKEKGPHRSLAFILRPNYPQLDNLQLLKQIVLQSLKV